MAITYRGERFSGYNKPKRTPKAKKSHAVLAKEGDKVRLIRFGQQGVSGAGKNPQTKKGKAMLFVKWTDPQDKFQSNKPKQSGSDPF